MASFLKNFKRSKLLLSLSCILLLTSSISLVSSPYSNTVFAQTTGNTSTATSKAKIGEYEWTGTYKKIDVTEPNPVIYKVYKSNIGEFSFKIKITDDCLKTDDCYSVGPAQQTVDYWFDPSRQPGETRSCKPVELTSNLKHQINVHYKPSTNHFNFVLAHNDSITPQSEAYGQFNFKKVCKFENRNIIDQLSDTPYLLNFANPRDGIELKPQTLTGITEDVGVEGWMTKYRYAITITGEPVVNEANEEVCDNKIDDNKNGQIDEDCGKAPIANAGTDQIDKTEGEIITLDGSASTDPEGGSLQYQWTKLVGSDAITLNNPNSVNPTFEIPPLKEGDAKDLQFQVQVADKDGLTDSDSVDVKISCLVDIYVDSFLPPWTDKGRIPNPAPLHVISDPETHKPLPPELQTRDYHEFSTDNRNTPSKGGSSREWSYVVVDMCSPDKYLVKKLHGIGESHGYRQVWKDGTWVEAEDKARAGSAGMKEDITKSGDKIVVRIDAASPLPLVHIKGVSVAPDIDYHYTITLSKDENNIIADITGQHDGFPAFQIYIGKVLADFHTPKKTQGQSPFSPFNEGQTLLSLFGSGDIDVTKSISIKKSEAYDKGFSPKQPTEAEEPIRCILNC